MVNGFVGFKLKKSGKVKFEKSIKAFQKKYRKHQGFYEMRLYQDMIYSADYFFYFCCKESYYVDVEFIMNQIYYFANKIYSMISRICKLNSLSISKIFKVILSVR